MSAVDFLDANIFVYAYDYFDPRKQKIAQEFVLRAIAGQFVSSPQVLAEFSATLLHKLSPRLTRADVTNALDALAPVKLVTPDHGMVRRAIEAHYEYGIRFYDGMILAAAERGGSAQIWSEDFNAGQEYFGVRIVNPF
jgi:predicted nucleic acid-binding protein